MNTSTPVLSDVRAGSGRCLLLPRMAAVVLVAVAWQVMGVLASLHRVGAAVARLMIRGPPAARTPTMAILLVPQLLLRAWAVQGILARSALFNPL